MRLIKRFLLFVMLLWLPLAAVAQGTSFDIPTLNAGLQPPGPQIERSTPQATLESFLSLTDAGNYDAAAHLLNLNAISVDEQAAQGPVLARQLATVMARKIVIDWSNILDRADALDTDAPSNDPIAATARRSLMLGMMELDYRPVALRLNRVKPANGDPVWVFASETVDNIPALHTLYGPSALEQRLPDALRSDAIWGLQWWELIGLPLMSLIALVASVLTWRGLETLARHQPSELISRLLRALRLPATLFILAVTLSFTTSRFFVVSGIVDNITGPIIVILFVASAMVLLVNVIDAMLKRLVSTLDVEDLSSPEYGDQRAQATTIAALRRLAIVFAVLVGLGIVLTSARIFSGIGASLLAGAGGLALILGFAAREVLGNIMASMQIAMNRSAKVGDQLVYDGHLCTVERIHFTFVQLKVWDDTRLIVPVSKFISDAFINRGTKTYGMVRHAVLTFAPHVDVSALRAHFFDWADGDDRADGDPDNTSCVVVGQSETGIKVRFAAQVTNPPDGWGFECDMREEMLRFAVERGKDDGTEYLAHLGTSRDRVSQDAGDDPQG
ncbi:mechanosensitive ion channel family protein [Loktanella sp. SALINAS62]|uniref:mechanosensitive ion channel family protein n=1 Tax=Loktanella sp. SALINAS62 TaxID=2706124 RepID=UPI001B8B819C|nr:mechanosensitive ion channel family protein [Loktanella sp. SALINAS62]MBS1301591.1 mechanosensitive ion channel family protein [Loktanella sp. SALINAS62]